MKKRHQKYINACEFIRVMIKKQDLDKYDSKIDGYIPFLPVSFALYSLKESTYLSDLDNRTKSLIYLIYISKTTSHRIVNFVLEFPSRRILKPKKESIQVAGERI